MLLLSVPQAPLFSQEALPIPPHRSVSVKAALRTQATGHKETRPDTAPPDTYTQEKAALVRAQQSRCFQPLQGRGDLAQERGREAEGEGPGSKYTKSTGSSCNPHQPQSQAGTELAGPPEDGRGAWA